MDVHTHVPEVRPTVSEPDPIRAVGFRLVKPLNTVTMPEEDVDLMWQFVRTQEYMFTDFERGNEIGWKARFRDMRHLHLDFGGDGYAILLNAWCCDTPELHYCVWNPKRTPREVLAAAEEVLRFAFEHLKATRVGSFIPDNHAIAIKMAGMLGMRYEGCIRQAYRFFNKSYDVQAWGLLKPEWAARQERLNAKH